MIYFNFTDGSVVEGNFPEPENSNMGAYGAECCFKGIVRADIIDSKPVIAIEFSTYEKNALSTALNILNLAADKYNLLGAKIMHSIGRINVGEPCFLVCVKSEHRNKGFIALQWIVNEFKTNVPLFGKELFEDGTYFLKTNEK